MKNGLLLLAFPLLLVVYSATAQPAPDSPYAFAGFVEPDFPFITTTVNAGTIGPMYPERNVAIRCLILQLDHDAHACFDTDLLRVAATWTGDGISMKSMPQVSYHKAGNKKNGIPEILGKPITATGVYPGWQGVTFSAADPRPEGPNPAEVGRGPITSDLGKWHGVYVHENLAVLKYQVLGREILEMMTAVEVKGQTGISRIFKINPGKEALSVALGEFLQVSRFKAKNDRLQINHKSSNEITLIGIAGQVEDALIEDALIEDAKISFNNSRYATLNLPANNKSTSIRVVMWRGLRKDAGVFDQLLSAPSMEMPDTATGGPARWGEAATTTGQLGQPQGAFTVDNLALPLPNHWQRNVRVAAVDFFSNGEAAVSTFEGDVWLVSGITEDLSALRWKRFASGLSEPMSLAIVNDQIYVFGREGIIRLHDFNGDNEADFYENFSNLPIQTIESREYPLSMNPMPGGGFLISKNGAGDAGPKTNPSTINGFRAGGPHTGTLLSVSADGQTIKRIASGFRAPYSSIHPTEGWITASDQQGNYVPSTPLYFVREGEYFGVPATAHLPNLPQETKPLTWIPHQVDQSGAEQIWVLSEKMGPLNNSLVHLSYGNPGIYKIYYDATWQGGISKLPLYLPGPLIKGKVNARDGWLYLAGFQVWGSEADSISALSRIRYTGGPMDIPASFNAGKQGILLHFEQPLNPVAARSISNYSSERWTYKRTDQYGSGHFLPSGEPGHESVAINAASISEDEHTIFLQVDDMQEVMQMSIAYTLENKEGDVLSDTVYFTLNALPDLSLKEHGFEIQDWRNASVQTGQLNTEGQKNVKETVSPTAALGKDLYLRLGCVACHSDDGTSEGMDGPTLQGLFGKTRNFKDGSSGIADEAYIKESLVDPGARVIAGRDVEMPSYLGVMNENEIMSIVLFVKSLKN